MLIFTNLPDLKDAKAFAGQIRPETSRVLDARVFESAYDARIWQLKTRGYERRKPFTGGGGWLQAEYGITVIMDGDYDDEENYPKTDRAVRRRHSAR